VPARLATIEYDPNRSARIGLLHYRDGEKRYMLLPHGLKVGDVVVAGPDAEARSATRCRSRTSRSAPPIHNIELDPGKGGQIVRSPASRPSSCARRARSRPSGCRRARCARADRLHGHVGQVSNLDHENQNLGKAGRARISGSGPRSAVSS
jgi:large subunit ribosomal protein L2